MRSVHLVLTRFAVRVPSFDGVAGPTAPLSPAWIARRLALFRRYCLPSMQAQTMRDFRWRLYVHADFDPAIADTLRACDPRIEVTSDPVSPLPADVGRDVDLVISTRIDSDDGFRATALETIEAYGPRFLAGADPVRVVCLQHGYYVHHQRRIAYQHRGWSFQSLFERGGGLCRGVLEVSCDDLNQRYPTWVHEAPAWSRVVHGTNLRNRFEPRGHQVLPAAQLPDGFDFVAGRSA
jgi:hypothetical protein